MKDQTNRERLDALTEEDIVAAIETLQRTLTASDNLLIYYAGHGVLDPDTNLGYWLPIDATVDSPANWISNKFVAKLIRGIPAKHVIVVADACYSGSFARGELLSGSGITDVDQLVWLRSRTAFSSGDLEEVLDAGGGNNSLFAHHFLAALNGNTGTVNGIQLAGEVRALVRKEASQTPQYGAVPSAGHDEGADFLFIKRK